MIARLEHFLREAELVEARRVHPVDPALVQEDEEDDVCKNKTKNESINKVVIGRESGTGAPSRKQPMR